ncbi:chain length determinant protein tyrosine kinase EpsG [Silvimonas terrae]|uniref:Chain length determinant protein tyrosine kinase EpsG n=1 Tax=Silvimonas terrae TaxID=300266 RepID=A0A840RCW1_9NEIS|nr:polysaccharide biosynthesis tyrosine autokinase [Silvimonas terrae]MBB5190807.1 chain length determinant protein tyrosine kinase EpsG [Silvimonas terrae]
MKNELIVAEAADQSARIGQILLGDGKLTQAQVDQITEVQMETGMRFGEAAIKLGHVTDEDIRRAVARQFDYSWLDARDGAYDASLVAAYKPFSREVEQLRNLRSQLVLREDAVAERCFVVASVDDESASSWVAANLAVVFAQLGERTLLIDANLRSPNLQKLFRLGTGHGLADILAGRSGNDCIQHLGQLGDLSVLTSGTVPPNPQELLSRQAFRGLLQEARPHNDVIIIDSPPLTDGADVQLLAARAGAAVLVARRHKSSVRAMLQLRDELLVTGATVLGVVMLN